MGDSPSPTTCVKCTGMCSRRVGGVCHGCVAGIGGFERPKQQWEILDKLFARFVEHQRELQQRKAVAGDWIEMQTESGSYKEVFLERIHRDGSLDVAWFNRIKRDWVRAARVSRSLCRTHGSSPYLMALDKLKIARTVGITNYKDPKNGAGGVDEVGMLFAEWKRAKRAQQQSS